MQPEAVAHTCALSVIARSFTLAVENSEWSLPRVASTIPIAQRYRLRLPPLLFPLHNDQKSNFVTSASVIRHGDLRLPIQPETVSHTCAFSTTTRLFSLME